MDKTFFERVNSLNIAREIDAKCKRTPRLPAYNKSINYETNCVISRVLEVLNFWKESNLIPSMIYITTSSELAGKLVLPSNVELIPIILSTDQYIENKVLGTFTVTTESGDNKSIYIKATTGIAYSSRPSLDYHNTRWILQEIDCNDPDIAHDLAIKL